MYQELIDFLGKERVLCGEPLSRHTSFKIGGPADVLVRPSEADQLAGVLQICRSSRIPYFILGNGSNLLVSDSGFRGAAICLDGFDRLCISGEWEKGMILYAGAGVLLSSFASFALKQGQTGLEFASGIPGSVGGAIWMNAGAYGGEISQVLFESECLNPQSGQIKRLSGAAHQFAYRHSVYQENDGIILGGFFRLRTGTQKQISGEMKRLSCLRREKQPLSYPSAGSAFRRPEGHYAAALIEQCGLKGYRCGNAQISEKHCGFIINLGGASCEDVLSVIEYTRKCVFEQTGILLEPEIKYIG